MTLTLLALALARIEHKITAVLERIERMSPALQALSDQVAANKAVTDSAVALIKGLSAQIAAGAGDAAAMTQLAADLHAQADALGAAVSANTPAAPAPSA
jgi:hypothetical protein